MMLKENCCTWMHILVLAGERDTYSLPTSVQLFIL